MARKWIRGKMYDLVKWDALINNKREGEMGIKDLKVQNESLLLK